MSYTPPVGSAVIFDFGLTSSTGGLIVNALVKRDDGRVQVATADNILATKYEGVIGDGSTTVFTVTHNLGTRDIVVQLLQDLGSGTYQEVFALITITDINTITITFTSAPASSGILVSIFG